MSLPPPLAAPKLYTMTQACEQGSHDGDARMWEVANWSKVEAKKTIQGSEKDVCGM